MKWIIIFFYFRRKMATYRGQGSDKYDIGAKPPYVNWTVVRGDTASFRVYVTNDAKDPLNIDDWNISMQIKRPTAPVTPGVITDNATLILTLVPIADPDDEPGEFTVSLTAAQSMILQTNDIFDIELSLPQDETVWTVAQGKMIILEDVTA
jgi:hypothetical protein